MPGVVAEISNTSSCVISASESKAGQQAPDRRGKAYLPISAMGSLRVTPVVPPTPLELCYPIPCTRFSPYIFGGGGAIFGGGQRPKNVRVAEEEEGFDAVQTEGFTGAQTEALGQVGGGLEIRLTPHIGWVSDFSWNFVNGPENNFGMVRTGVNFAF